MTSTPNTRERVLVSDLKKFAYEIRRLALYMVHRADSSHIGGALSCADILAFLYGHALRVDPRNPLWASRDRFIMSKGHCCVSLYAALALRGFFPREVLDTYGQEGSVLMAHASHGVPGVEWSTGSLGHGLGLGCGQALAAKRRRQDWRVVVLLSDGELNEGSTWEAIQFAAHHDLDNLTVIVDRNRQQAMGSTDKIIKLVNLADKFNSFGWEATDADGHSFSSLLNARDRRVEPKSPLCIVAHTIKGKGVTYMEDKLEWHYRSPKTRNLYEKALRELDRNYKMS